MTLEGQLRLFQALTVLALGLATAALCVATRPRPEPSVLEAHDAERRTVVSADGVDFLVAGRRIVHLGADGLVTPGARVDGNGVAALSPDGSPDAVLAADGDHAWLALHSAHGDVRGDAGGQGDVTFSLTSPDDTRAITSTVAPTGSPAFALDDHGESTEIRASGVQESP
jgi:hypothetical protein